MEQGTSLKSESTDGNKTIALVLCSLAVFFMMYMATGVNVALPVIIREFKADAILTGWIATAPLLTIAILLVPFGRIADIVGIKRIFTLGVLVFTAASALCAFSGSTAMLIASRSLQAVGVAMLLGNSMAMVTAIYPANERGRALGIVFASIYTGSSTGPFLGGMITEHLGWRSIFLFNIPVGLAITLLLVLKIKGEWRASRGEKFDITGAVIYGLAVIGLIYGFSNLPGILGIILVPVGIGGLVAFFRWETGHRSPLLDVRIFKNNRTFVFSNLAALISYCAVSAVVFLLSLYLQYIKGFSPQVAGAVLVAQPVMQVITSPFTGRLSDKVEPRIVSSAGMALVCGGLVSFIFLADTTSVARIIVSLMILGIGFALFSSPNANAVMSSVTPKYIGVASATMHTMIALANAFSMGITMIIMGMVMGRVVITQEYYPAFLTTARIGFGVFSAICFGGIFVSLSRGKVHRVQIQNSK